MRERSHDKFSRAGFTNRQNWKVTVHVTVQKRAPSLQNVIYKKIQQNGQVTRGNSATQISATPKNATGKNATSNAFHKEKQD